MLGKAQNWFVSPQRRKGREEVIFLFGGERPPNKKFAAFQAYLWPQAWVFWRIGPGRACVREISPCGTKASGW